MSEHTITTIEQLRALIGDAIPAVGLKVLEALDEQMNEFIRCSPMLLLSTADANGHQQVSPKGDGPGFTEIADEHTLLIPSRVGNRLAYGLSGVIENPQVGLIFIRPGTSETLRVNGTAVLSTEPELLERLSARGKPAEIIIRVKVRECFFHCAKAFLRSRLWDPDTWSEPQRISFGRQIAPRLNLDAEAAAKIDAGVESGYQESEL
ncbi:MAG: pyridoxamine 5'-phosphate oxidase family protein [bacterium]|nr:pyridoxamine 5'-phosphate oxidase family protein [bacterium]